jgi:hypothetical protein
MAEHQLRVIGGEAIERFGLKLVIIHHRVGFVPVGKARFPRVAAPHRAEAVQAVEWLVQTEEKGPHLEATRFKSTRRAGLPDENTSNHHQ